VATTTRSRSRKSG